MFLVLVCPSLALSVLFIDRCAVLFLDPTFLSSLIYIFLFILLSNFPFQIKVYVVTSYASTNTVIFILSFLSILSDNTTCVVIPLSLIPLFSLYPITDAIFTTRETPVTPPERPQRSYHLKRTRWFFSRTQVCKIDQYVLIRRKKYSASGSVFPPSNGLSGVIFFLLSFWSTWAH